VNFLDLKKKEKPRKLKYAFLSKEAISYRLEAITNSSGEVLGLIILKSSLKGCQPYREGNTEKRFL